MKLIPQLYVIKQHRKSVIIAINSVQRRQFFLRLILILPSCNEGVVLTAVLPRAVHPLPIRVAPVPRRNDVARRAHQGLGPKLRHNFLIKESAFYLAIKPPMAHIAEIPSPEYNLP